MCLCSTADQHASTHMQCSSDFCCYTLSELSFHVPSAVTLCPSSPFTFLLLLHFVQALLSRSSCCYTLSKLSFHVPVAVTLCPSSPFTFLLLLHFVFVLWSHPPLFTLHRLLPTYFHLPLVLFLPHSLLLTTPFLLTTSFLCSVHVCLLEPASMLGRGTTSICIMISTQPRCTRLTTFHFVQSLVASFPGARKIGGSAWYTLFAHAQSLLGNPHTTPLH